MHRASSVDVFDNVGGGFYLLFFSLSLSHTRSSRPHSNNIDSYYEQLNELYLVFMVQKLKIDEFRRITFWEHLKWNYYIYKI